MTVRRLVRPVTGQRSQRLWSGRQLIVLLVGPLVIGVPDGAEIIDLCAAVLAAAAIVPHGLKLLSSRGGSIVPPDMNR